MCSFGEDGPGDPNHFVGQGAGHDIRVSPTEHPSDPFAQRIGSGVDVRHGHPRPLNEESSQVLVAAFADAEQGGFAAGAVLARHQANRRGNLAGIGELMGIAQFDWPTRWR